MSQVGRQFAGYFGLLTAADHCSLCL